MCKTDLVGVGVKFERVGRITGYAAKIDRWNDAKQHEKQDRVVHSVQTRRPACCH